MIMILAFPIISGVKICEKKLKCHMVRKKAGFEIATQNTDS